MALASPRNLALALLPQALALAAVPMVPSLHLEVATAQGDFREEMGSKTGMGAALSLAMPMTTTLSFRPILAFQSFPVLGSTYTYKSTRYSDRGSENARWSAWSYGVDVLYRPGGPNGSLYLLAGASMKVWKLHSFGSLTTQDALNPARVYTVNDQSTKNEPAVAFGLGCAFNRHLSVEARSVLASYRALSYNTLELALVLSY